MKPSGETSTFTQCLLVKKDDETEKFDHIVRWLPSEFAKVGKILDFQTSDGWRVVETYAVYGETLITRYPADFKVSYPITVR